MRETTVKSLTPVLAGGLLLIGMAALLCARSAAVTLINKSAGLEAPTKEEGNTEFEFGDVNGDGELDLVSVGDHGSPYVNSDQHGIMVWLGNGSGNWAVHQFENFGYGGCALGDLNWDGLTDVAWGIHHNWGTSSMASRLMGAALGDGSGAYWTDYGEGLASNGEQWGMFATAVADFDGDGLLDIVSQSFGGSNGIRLYRNQGDGTWSQAYALTGGSVGYTIEAADVNADGYPDIVSTRSGTNVLLGNGGFGFTVLNTGLPGSGVHGIAVGDVNLDGFLDISFGYSSSGVRCYTFGGTQWNDASSGLPTSGYHDLTQLGDVDGDGFLDLVAYDPPTGKVYLGNGGGGWTADATWTMPSPGDASALRVDGDMDHDGREDIAISGSMSGFPFYRNQLRVYSPWDEPSELSARVVYPQGGETCRTGTVRFIEWLAAVPPEDGAAAVDLELSANGPGGPWSAIASGLPNNGRYQWAVDAPAAAEDARIRMTLTSTSGSVQVLSPGGFRILGDFSSVDSGEWDEADSWGGSEADASLATAVHLELFPNPAQSRISILADRAIDEPAHVSLHDLTGRQIRSRRIDLGTVATTLALRDHSGSPLAAGRYFVRVRGDGIEGTSPLIICP
jgi:hypothetical protein